MKLTPVASRKEKKNLIFEVVWTRQGYSQPLKQEKGL
jgi:hypothetical protein